MSSTLCQPLERIHGIPLQQQSAAIRYYLSDLWGTRLVLDANANVLGRQAHLPFGEEFAGSGSQEKHHFT
ncbi:MAG: hypothetical protein WAV20_06835, partial [Blastocatellia bacterium]